MAPGGVGHRSYGDVGEGKEYNQVAKSDHYLRCGKEGGGGFVNEVWRLWHASALR